MQVSGGDDGCIQLIYALHVGVQTNSGLSNLLSETRKQRETLFETCHEKTGF